MQRTAKVVPINQYSIINPTYESLVTLKCEPNPEIDSLPPINLRGTLWMEAIKEFEPNLDNETEDLKLKEEKTVNPNPENQEESI